MARADQLQVAAKIRGLQTEECEVDGAEPVVDGKGRGRGRGKGRGGRGRGMKKPSAAEKPSGWYRAKAPETPKGRGTGAMTSPSSTPKTEPKAKAKRAQKPKTKPSPKVTKPKTKPSPKVTKPKTKPSPKKNATKKDQQQECKPKAKSKPTRKRQVEVEDSGSNKKPKKTETSPAPKERKTKATFARRNVPKKDPSKTFHLCVRAAFENHIERLVRFPGKLEDPSRGKAGWIFFGVLNWHDHKGF